MNDKIFDNLDNEIKKKAETRDMYKIIFTDAEGKDIEYEIVATFKDKANNKIYYIVTDNTRGPNNELKITAYYINYMENNNELDDFNNTFYPVIDDDELQMVMDVFNNIKDRL